MMKTKQEVEKLKHHMRECKQLLADDNGNAGEYLEGFLDGIEWVLQGKEEENKEVYKSPYTSTKYVWEQPKISKTKTQKGRIWTLVEDEYIKQNYQHKPYRTIARKLRRSTGSIAQRVHDLHKKTGLPLKKR